MKALLLVMMILGIFRIGRCQVSDTLEAVFVYGKVDSIVKMSVLTASVPFYQLNDFVLQNMGVIDIGEALKHIPGANIKDYGGIGGLKTVNYRSLGSAHTGIEQDGISIPDQQTGTINLGNYAIFGIESLEMSSGQVQHLHSFASSFLKANMISVFNNISSLPKTKTLIKTQTEWQSVNALQNGILIKQKIGKRFTAGGQGVYRFGSGIYNYQLANGQNTIEGQRAPTNLKQAQFNGAIQYHHKNLHFIVQGSHQNSDQNLPGAVVFYNPKNKETLTRENSSSSIIGKYQSKKQLVTGHIFAQNSKTKYFQDFVLNSKGYIENSYSQNQIGTGFMYHYYLGSPTQSLFIGSDIIQSNLEGSQYEKEPIRQSLNSVVGITKWLGRFKIQGNLTHQQISDQSIEDKANFSHISPFLSLSYVPFKNRSFRIRSFYKNTFRMPSFNDLYYRSIGNIDLSPEKANLFNIGVTLKKEIASFNLETTIDVYQNDVENKIIAIPTKNLFNWSMQNIGRTQGRGIDISFSLTKTIVNSRIILLTNQSINRSIDNTDENGFTFGHQLPYTPIYFASYHFNFLHKFFTSSINILHSGSRYVLTENIAHNYLEGFIDLGFNLAKSFNLKKEQLLTTKFQINNIFDKNYQVVRSFPMPGRHFIFTLQYQFKQ
ncbi:MAG: TonB-dependent receptor [Crocinitomicaceae bacterium]